LGRGLGGGGYELQNNILLVSYLALLSAPRSFFLYVNVGVGKTNTHDNRTGSSKQTPPPRPSIQQQSLAVLHTLFNIFRPEWQQNPASEDKIWLFVKNTSLISFYQN
jgi:hypothetical protein